MATSSSDTAFLTMEKSFNYRGAREHWSNAYHLQETPSDHASWLALANRVWDYEKMFLDASVELEYAYGHDPGTPPVLVFENDFAPVGEGGPAGQFVPAAGAHPTPGDAAVYIRYSTTQKSTLGKPIYLWNYYHGVYYDAAAGDVMDSTQHTQLDALGAIWVSGLNVPGATPALYHRAGPRGAVAQGHKIGDFITTRTLKHRGRHHRRLPAGTTVQYPSITIPGPISIN